MSSGLLKNRKLVEIVVKKCQSKITHTTIYTIR